MLLAQRGLPSARLIAVTLRRRRARGRQRQHAELLPRPRHRRDDAAHLAPPAGRQGGRGRRSSRARRWSPASCSGSPSTLLLGLAGQLAVGGARRRGDPVLRLRLHAGPQAPDRVQHRDRRRGRLLPGAGRLGRRHRNRSAWPAIVLFAVIFFWTPPHFWALAMKFTRRLRGGQRADAAGGRHAGRRGPQDRRSTPTRWWWPRSRWPRTRAGSTAAFAAVLGGWFLLEAHRLRGRIAAGDAPAPMRLFHLSIALPDLAVRGHRGDRAAAVRALVAAAGRWT